MTKFKGVHGGTLVVYARDWMKVDPWSVIFEINDAIGGKAKTTITDLETIQEIADELAAYVPRAREEVRRRGEVAKAEAEKKAAEEAEAKRKREAEGAAKAA